jgi:hypothetical protein
MAELPRETASLCPHCLARIPATLAPDGEDVVMTKRCPSHGSFRTVVWRGGPSLAGWKRPKPVARVASHRTATRKGCPFDCGICPEHRQVGCTGLLELTQRCNLSCPVCFADSGATGAVDPSLEVIAGWYRRILEVDGLCSIQLSGGEPTLRDDLPEILALGRQHGFTFLQLNSNGLRLAADPDYARSLKQAGLVSVFLQFDGVDDAIYRKLRGRPLLREKLRAIEHCIAAGLGVVLVPTLVPGVNSGHLGEIIRAALELGPGVRGVHFQPAAHFGRFPDAGAARMTLPEVMTAIEQQTHGLVSVAHFRPPGCEHERCSFHGSFIRQDGGLRPLSTSGQACCARPGSDVARTVALVARQWAAPRRLHRPAGQPLGARPPMTLDDFLQESTEHSFTLSGMAFQDVWTLDLERLSACCIHVAAPDGRLIPFCAYNLTASDGTPLYRGCC